MTSNTDWTEELTAEMVRLWKDGLSATQIAIKLHLKTRNTVIGKIHRLGLHGLQRAPRQARLPKPPPARHKPEPKPVEPPADALPAPAPPAPPPASPEPAPAPPAPPPAAGPPPFSLGILELKYGQCRWPGPESTDYTFCGEPSVPFESYCEKHLNLSVSGGLPAARRAIRNWQ